MAKRKWCSAAWASVTGSLTPRVKVPQDGELRYLSDTWQLWLIFLSTTVFTASFIPALARSRTASNVVSCNADGIVETPSTKPLSIWDADEFFTINLLFNDYSFTQAKVIDACWDVGVGRGGQAIAAVVTHRVLRRSMLLILERSEVSIPTTTAMLCQQIQLTSIWELCREMIRRAGGGSTPKRARAMGILRYTLYIFVCGYVLAFATITSVMTGYRANLTGLFQLNSTQNGMTEPLRLVYAGKDSTVVSDGGRIGGRDNWILPGFDRRDDFEIVAPITECKHCRSAVICGLLTDSRKDHERCAEAYSYCQLMIDQILTAARNFTCQQSECSCTVPMDCSSHDNITSSITIGNVPWKLPGPPLNISVPVTSTTRRWTNGSEDFYERPEYSAS